MGRSESPTLLPPHFVAFAWRYHGSTRVLFPRCRVRQRGPGVDKPVPHRRITVETAGTPRFLGNPLSLCPVLRPRQDRTRQAIATCRHGPRYDHNEGSHDNSLSRLNRTASGLAVYASPDAVTRTGRKTRFRPLAKRYRTGLVTRRVPMKGFRVAPYISSPFPKLAWRNTILDCFCEKQPHASPGRVGGASNR